MLDDAAPRTPAVMLSAAAPRSSSARRARTPCFAAAYLPPPAPRRRGLRAQPQYGFTAMRSVRCAAAAARSRQRVAPMPIFLLLPACSAVAVFAAPDTTARFFFCGRCAYQIFPFTPARAVDASHRHFPALLRVARETASSMLHGCQIIAPRVADAAVARGICVLLLFRRAFLSRQVGCESQLRSFCLLFFRAAFAAKCHARSHAQPDNDVRSSDCAKTQRGENAMCAFCWHAFRKVFAALIRRWRDGVMLDA